MRTYKWFTALSIILAVIILPAAASADAILLNSDLLNEGNNLTSENVRIPNPHAVWAPNGSDYFWVSYADTGNSSPIENTFWNVVDFDNPFAVFYESFSLPYEINTGQLTIWADDTAGVYLGRMDSSGNYDYDLLAAPFPTQGSYCAAGAIGCLADNPAYGLVSTGLTMDLTSLTLGAGDYQFRFDTYQRGGGPFGIMYTGFMDSQPVPEPSTLLLLTGGLGCIGFLLRRKR